MRMLEQEQDVRRPARLPIVDERPLKRERVSIGHDAEPAHFERMEHDLGVLLRVAASSAAVRQLPPERRQPTT